MIGGIYFSPFYILGVDILNIIWYSNYRLREGEVTMINNFRELTAEERQQMKDFANRHRLDYYIPDDGELLWFQLEGLKVYVIGVNGDEGIQYQVEVYRMTRCAMKHFVYLESVLKYIEFEYLPPVHKEGITLSGN